MFSMIGSASLICSSVFVKFQMAFTPIGADLIGDVVGHGLRHTENGDVRLELGKNVVERGEVMHHDAVHFLADEVGVDVERGLEGEAVLLEAEVLHQRAADVADADQNGRVVAIHAKDLGDLAAQRHNVVAIALLAELTEAAEILTDLRGGQAHLAAQLAGRDAARSRQHSDRQASGDSGAFF